jgi:threonine aldolase
LARRSNALAARLANGTEQLAGASLAAPVEANEVFLDLPPAGVDWLSEQGFLFFRRSPSRIRLVCRFDQSERDVDLFLEALARMPHSRE